MPNTATSDLAAWQQMQSYLAASGWMTGGVTIGEPKAPPEPLTGCILGDAGEIDETVLNSPREIHRAIIRVYAPFIEEPTQNVESSLEQVRANIWADICGDFDIGGNIAYIMPTRCSWRWGNLQVGQQIYRVLDVSIAYRVDERATFVA